MREDPGIFSRRRKMAAACDPGDGGTPVSRGSDDFSETQFVAQAITELQEVSLPAVQQWDSSRQLNSDGGTTLVTELIMVTSGEATVDTGHVSMATNITGTDENQGTYHVIPRDQMPSIMTVDQSAAHTGDSGQLQPDSGQLPPDNEQLQLDSGQSQPDKDSQSQGGQEGDQVSQEMAGQADVIYFIEDGTITRAEDRSYVDTAVQANDYEIERRSGRLPARRRVIPYKFRDYRSGDGSDQETGDSDYEPDIKPRAKRPHIGGPAVGVTPIGKKGPGRPRKHPLPSGSMIVVSPQPASSEEGVLPTNQAPAIPPVEEQPPVDTKEGILESQVHVAPARRGRGRPRGPYWDKVYKCSQCTKSFSQRGNLKVHMRIHTDERPFHCEEPDCQKSFRSNESLRRHILSHQGVKLFECTVCNKKFSSNISLQEHISRHTDSKPYKCKHCDRHFRQISCLRRHIFTHSNEHPFVCSVCSRRFSQMVYLRSHMKIHTGEKPFSCSTCGKLFAHQSDVARHKIVHTGEKPFVCGICGSMFSDRSSKRRHEKEHANRKPYVCQLCTESFKRPGQLKAHLSRKHSNIVHVKIEKEGGNFVFSYQDAKEDKNLTGQDVGESQQRIVKLIENLHSKAVVQHVEIRMPPNSGQKTSGEENAEHGDTVVMATDQVAPMSQSGKELEGSIMETPEGIPIELQGVEIQGAEEQTYIALADLAESLIEKGPAGDTVEYQIIQEAGADGGQQIQLVQFTPEEITAASETSATTPTGPADVPREEPPPAQTTETETQLDPSTEPDTGASNPGDNPVAGSQATPVDLGKTADYVKNPDFSSQEYYNWLSNFTELCKLVPMPLDVSLFQKISQVHKTLSDVMATPSGVIADKDNFRVLMNISRELSTIINEHLVFVLQNLNQEEKDQRK